MACGWSTVSCCIAGVVRLPPSRYACPTVTEPCGSNLPEKAVRFGIQIPTMLLPPNFFLLVLSGRVIHVLGVVGHENGAACPDAPQCPPGYIPRAVPILSD